MNLAPSELEGRRIAFGIGAQVDFGREAAARAPECFAILIPPFAPAACWCARTIVESMACSSLAGGPRLASVSNAASHTPSLLQRVKRTKTEFQLPYRLGMSRHGAQNPKDAVDRDGRAGTVRAMDQLLTKQKGESLGFKPKFANWRRRAKVPVLLLNPPRRAWHHSPPLDRLP